MRRVIQCALAVAALVGASGSARAQALGPFRQFLAIEPFYERTSLDNGSGVDKINFNGYGARLWINLDPFHFIPHGSIALSGSYAPSHDVGGNASTTLRILGAEYDQFFVNRPLGGVIDPFLTAGYSRFRIRTQISGTSASSSYNGLPLGGGIRIPLPNRFELRGDVKDLILFNTPTGTAFSNRRTNNLLLQAALGLTF
jgi:hypothetical protein